MNSVDPLPGLGLHPRLQWRPLTFHGHPKQRRRSDQTADWSSPPVPRSSHVRDVTLDKQFPLGDHPFESIVRIHEAANRPPDWANSVGHRDSKRSTTTSDCLDRCALTPANDPNAAAARANSSLWRPQCRRPWPLMSANWLIALLAVISLNSIGGFARAGDPNAGSTIPSAEQSGGTQMRLLMLLLHKTTHQYNNSTPELSRVHPGGDILRTDGFDQAQDNPQHILLNSTGDAYHRPTATSPATTSRKGAKLTPAADQPPGHQSDGRQNGATFMDVAIVASSAPSYVSLNSENNTNQINITAHISNNSNSTGSKDRAKRREELLLKYTKNRAIGDRAYYILLAVYALFIAFGTISNAIICLTVILKPKVLSPRNIFIVNLAASDLLLCVFTMPFSFVEITMKMWQLGLIPCKLVSGLQATSVFVSTISITVIALDRYKVIVYPTHQESANGTKGAAIMLVCVWFVALGLASPLFTFRTVEHYDMPKHDGFGDFGSIDFCIESWPFAHGRGIYSVISMIVQYVLPITIVSVVYAKISDRLQKRLIRRQRLTQLECQQKRQLNLIRRTHTMLVSVSLVFGFSWLPLNLLNVISDFSPLLVNDDQMFRIIFAICHLTGCSSACSNPILYGYWNENFRKEVYQVYTQYMQWVMRRIRNCKLCRDCLLAQKACDNLGLYSASSTSASPRSSMSASSSSSSSSSSASKLRSTATSRTGSESASELSDTSMAQSSCSDDLADSADDISSVSYRNPGLRAAAAAAAAPRHRSANVSMMMMMLTDRDGGGEGEGEDLLKYQDRHQLEAAYQRMCDQKNDRESLEIRVSNSNLAHQPADLVRPIRHAHVLSARSLPSMVVGHGRATESLLVDDLTSDKPLADWPVGHSHQISRATPQRKSIQRDYIEKSSSDTRDNPVTNIRDSSLYSEWPRASSEQNSNARGQNRGKMMSEASDGKHERIDLIPISEKQIQSSQKPERRFSDILKKRSLVATTNESRQSFTESMRVCFCISCAASSLEILAPARINNLTPTAGETTLDASVIGAITKPNDGNCPRSASRNRFSLDAESAISDVNDLDANSNKEMKKADDEAADSINSSAMIANRRLVSGDKIRRPWKERGPPPGFSVDKRATTTSSGLSNEHRRLDDSRDSMNERVVARRKQSTMATDKAAAGLHPIESTSGENRITRRGGKRRGRRKKKGKKSHRSRRRLESSLFAETQKPFDCECSCHNEPIEQPYQCDRRSCGYVQQSRQHVQSNSIAESPTAGAANNWPSESHPDSSELQLLPSNPPKLARKHDDHQYAQTNQDNTTPTDLHLKSNGQRVWLRLSSAPGAQIADCQVGAVQHSGAECPGKSANNETAHGVGTLTTTKSTTTIVRNPPGLELVRLHPSQQQQLPVFISDCSGIKRSISHDGYNDSCRRNFVLPPDARDVTISGGRLSNRKELSMAAEEAANFASKSSAASDQRQASDVGDGAAADENRALHKEQAASRNRNYDGRRWLRSGAKGSCESSTRLHSITSGSVKLQNHPKASTTVNNQLPYCFKCKHNRLPLMTNENSGKSKRPKSSRRRRSQRKSRDHDKSAFGSSEFDGKIEKKRKTKHSQLTGELSESAKRDDKQSEVKSNIFLCARIDPAKIRRKLAAAPEKIYQLHSTATRLMRSVSSERSAKSPDIEEAACGASSQLNAADHQHSASDRRKAQDSSKTELRDSLGANSSSRLTYPQVGTCYLTVDLGPSRGESEVSFISRADRSTSVVLLGSEEPECREKLATESDSSHADRQTTQTNERIEFGNQANAEQVRIELHDESSIKSEPNNNEHQPTADDQDKGQAEVEVPGSPMRELQSLNSSTSRSNSLSSSFCMATHSLSFVTTSGSTTSSSYSCSLSSCQMFSLGKPHLSCRKYSESELGANGNIAITDGNMKASLSGSLKDENSCDLSCGLAERLSCGPMTNHASVSPNNSNHGNTMTQANHRDSVIMCNSVATSSGRDHSMPDYDVKSNNSKSTYATGDSRMQQQMDTAE